MSSDHPRPSDKRAAFVGLIVSAIVLFAIAFTIVELTNRKFAGHEPAAEASK